MIQVAIDLKYYNQTTKTHHDAQWRLLMPAAPTVDLKYVDHLGRDVFFEAKYVWFDSRIKAYRVRTKQQILYRDENWAYTLEQTAEFVQEWEYPEVREAWDEKGGEE